MKKIFRLLVIGLMVLGWLKTANEAQAVSINIYQKRSGQNCYYVDGSASGSPGCIDEKSQIYVSVKGVAANKGIVIKEQTNGSGDYHTIASSRVDSSGNFSTFIGAKSSGTYYLTFSVGGQVIAKPILAVGSACSSSGCETDETDILISFFELCNQIPRNLKSYQTCVDCFNNDGVWTAVGCIPTQSDKIVQVVLKISLMVGGGIALLIIISGAFTLSISAGDPQKTNNAKEMITSALIGLVFIIFSVTILQFIGVQIFHIPGFGS